MAGEYDINLSDGSVLATLHPMEVSGPSNESTPRQVLRINDSSPVVGAGGEIVIAGNVTYRFVPPFGFTLFGSGSPPDDPTPTTADGTYTVHSNSFIRFTYQAPHNTNGRLFGNTSSGGLFFLVSSPTTDYYVWFTDGTTTDPITSVDYDPGSNPESPLAGRTGIPVTINLGDAPDFVAAAIRAAVNPQADFTASIVPGRPDTVLIDIIAGVIPVGQSPQPGSATFPIGDVRTVIPVNEVVTSDPLDRFGQVTYVNNDPSTTLSLPGRGTLNYGEHFIDNFVHLLENFAADTNPDDNTDLGAAAYTQALRGQWWYNTTTNQEGFLFYDGTQWTRDYDMDTGILIFRDPENTTGPSTPNVDITVTGSDPLFPDVGLAIRTLENPTAEESILRVMSEGGSERLRVEHDGWVETTNNLEVQAVTNGNNKSYIHGTLAIGGRIDGNITTSREVELVSTRTLTVQGDGIAVNSDAAHDAALLLNSPAGMSSHVEFFFDGTLNGNITVDDTTLDNAMLINSATTNDVVMVTGGGNVGINQVDPSRRLDVVGETELNGDVYVINSDEIFNDGFGLESVSGGLLKTGLGGKTWQATPADNTAAGFVVNDSLAAPVLVVDETTGTQVVQYDFLVDTDTLFVDVDNDYVGVNMVPIYPLDVTGNTRIAGRVGINQAPPVSGVPVGTDIWLAVTGDIQANSQFLGSDGSGAEPTYSFTNDTDVGMYLDGTSLAFGVDAAPRMSIATDGTISVRTVDYENLVIAGDDDVVPNKKYVDDRIDSISWREPVIVRSQATYLDSSEFPLTGEIDDVTLSVGDRVLFGDVTTVADRDIWIWNGATWDRDNDPNLRTVGDTVYIAGGTDFGKIYAYNFEEEWAIIEGAATGTLFSVETIVATPGQTVFPLTTPYKPTDTGYRLMVYVDGVKYIKDLGYTEDAATQVTLIPPVPLVGGEVVEFYSMAESTPTANLKRESQTGLTGNPTIALALITYIVDSEALLVFINGQKAVQDIDYTEVTPTSLDWIGTPLVASDVLEFYNAVPITAGTEVMDIDDVKTEGITLTGGEILVYDFVTQLWTPTPGPGIEDGVSIDELVADGTGTQAVFATSFEVKAKVLGKAFQQVFVNGILQKEGATFAFTVTGANQITFNAGSEPPADADVTIYQL